MRNPETARRLDRIPFGQSQYQRRPQNPFQIAHWSQFIYPGDRKAEARAKGRQKYLAALWYIGPTMTAAQCAHLTRESVENVRNWREWTLDHPQGEDFALAVNVDGIPNRRRRATGRFDGDRVYKTCHPERLRPIAKASKYTRRRESAHPVKRESAHLDSKCNSESKNKGCDIDSRAASAARPCVPPARRAKTYSKPTPEQRPDRFIPRELLKRFCLEHHYGLLEGDARLGWIVKRTEARKKFHNAIGPHVRNVWRYVCAANRSIDARSDDPDQLRWLMESYSFAEIFNLDFCDSFFFPVVD